MIRRLFFRIWPHKHVWGRAYKTYSHPIGHELYHAGVGKQCKLCGIVQAVKQRKRKEG